MEQLYNITQAAKLLSTSRTSVYKWISRGLINVIKINGYTRIKESEIKRLRGEN